MRANKKMCVLLIAIAAGLLPLATGAMAQGPEKQPMSYQTFYLKNATSQRTANDISTAMRNLIPAAKIYYAETENALLVSGTSEELGQAQKMLNDLDKPQMVYRVTYTISDGHGIPQRLSMLVAKGKHAVTKQGSRVPIMTGSYKEGGGDAANTQFQYVDVGLNVDATMEGYADGLRLMSKIEETSISEQKSNVGIQDPVLDQSVLEVQSAVNTAKTVMLGSLNTGGGNHMDVQVAIEAAREQ